MTQQSGLGSNSNLSLGQLQGQSLGQLLQGQAGQLKAVAPSLTSDTTRLLDRLAEIGGRLQKVALTLTGQDGDNMLSGESPPVATSMLSYISAAHSVASKMEAHLRHIEERL